MYFLLLENGFALLLESGDHLLLEQQPPACPALLLEDGSYLLLEDGSYLLLEGDCGCIPYTPIGPALLKEDGFYLLLEDCSHLLLEGTGPLPPTPTPQGRGNRRGRLGDLNEALEDEDLLLILSLWLRIK